VIGHNVRFDLSFLCREFRNAAARLKKSLAAFPFLIPFASRAEDSVAVATAGIAVLIANCHPRNDRPTFKVERIVRLSRCDAVYITGSPTRANGEESSESTIPV
jgi:hypothetical protein